MKLDIEAIRKRNEAAERVCVEDCCSDPVHFGPRKDIRALLAEVESLRDLALMFEMAGREAVADAREFRAEVARLSAEVERLEHLADVCECEQVHETPIER